MDRKRKRLLTYFVALCMAFSVLTGLGPTNFLLYAATGAHTPLISENNVTFRFSTPSAYAVCLAGDFNNWESDLQTGIQLTQTQANVWEVTLNTDDFPALANLTNKYKFITYDEANGKAHWEEGDNHILYRTAFVIAANNLSIKKGEYLSLPNGTYYDEIAQRVKTIPASEVNYTLQEEAEGVTLEGNTLQVAETFTGDQITLEATYNAQSIPLQISVTEDNFTPVHINTDGTITFNVAYSGDTLYYVGTLTDWENSQKSMERVNGIFTYTTEAPVTPGVYEYKFKPYADKWDGNFNAEGTGENNSKIIIPGIKALNMNVELDKAYTLPEKVSIVQVDGTIEEVDATYSLVEANDAIQLSDKHLTVTSDFEGSSILLNVTAGEQTTQIVVQVVKQLYTYKINYIRPQGDYDGWGLWLWADTVESATYAFNKGLVSDYIQGEYQLGTKNLNFIIKKGEWEEKDCALDRVIEIPEGQSEVEVWLVQGDKNVYYSEPELSKHVVNAFMDSSKEIIVNLSEAPMQLDTFVLKDSKGQVIQGEATALTDTRIKFILTEDVAINVSELYTLESTEFKAAPVTMRGILDEAAYYYEGDDLGLTYEKGQSTFKIWAPTAQEVSLMIYQAPDDAAEQQVTMTRLSCGVWQVTVAGDLEGKYYDYRIAFADGTMNNAIDPYAKAVSINGGKGAIVDLSSTNPVDFEPENGPKLQNPTDAIVYELHVRDMSSQTGNGMDEYAGKYLALTKEGLTTAEGHPVGIDHLKSLGITHVQLQPIYDYGSVDEVALDSYNWGYDPQNYNVPEGSYATDPSDPGCRIYETKAMIKAFHDAGIGVIMDVVYNHTYNIATGPFEKVVPGYYYRMDADGEYTNGSGCGNEVASERPMVRKFIKDSVKYWATEYGMDGFRFDLMGLIDTETMKQVTKELKEEINPHIIIYGEPWTGGTSGLASESQTLKGSQKGTDFGVFNDNIRSSIKGDSDGDGAGFATGSTGQESDILEGVQGGIHTIATHPTEVVSYITAHDNLNLWDKVLSVMHLDTKHPYAHLDMNNILANESVKRDLLANGIVFTSQGISFMHAGEEMLRTKYGDSNSYKSSDEINKVRWENRDTFSPVFDYYQGLIALRKAHPAFRMTTNSEVATHFETYVKNNNVVAFGLKDYANGDSWKNIVVIYNANEAEQTIDLPHTANWKIVVNDTQAGTTTLQTLENATSVTVAPLSMMVLYDEATIYTPEATTLEVEDTNIGMAIGQSKLLKVTVKDQNGATMSGQNVIYTSTNEDVVSATANGKLMAHQEGNADIQLTCGKATLQLKVQVVKALMPNRIALTGTKDYVYASRTLQLSALVYDQFDKEMLDAKVKWSTSDTKIATVDAYGKVTGIQEGQVTITATVGSISESYVIYVKTYETRYVVIEYIREKQDYTDWNLWTWSTGVSDGQVDFKVTEDGKAIALVEIGPDTQSVGFIVRKGTDWADCKQDITADRYVYTDADQVVTKARIYEMVNDVTTLESVTAPVIDPEKQIITFNYRNNELFKTNRMNEIAKVMLEVNGKTYEMTYDAANEKFVYIYEGLEVGQYYYCYHVTYKDGRTVTSLDVNNPVTQNNQSVLTYEKYDLTITANVSPSAFNYKTSSLLNVEVACHEEETVAIKRIVADLSALGGESAVSIDPTLKSIALSVNDTVTAGQKTIPIKVYDIYGNCYQSAAQVEVTAAPQTEDFDWDEAVIYFMLTDRFNNGDTTNDDPLGIGYDQTVSGSYHGGDFKGITDKLDYLKDLGVNTIWISPIVEQIGQNIGDTNNCYYAYHGYWAKDFERLNPHFGSLEDLKELIDAAHSKGIKIMVDVVINHAGYGLKTGETGADPNFPSLVDQLKYEGMFRTDGSTDTIYGEISGLPDFITEDESIRETVLNWQTAWIEKCTTSKGNTIDYFRIDTAKHVDKATLQALKIAATKVKPDFKYILEAWYSGNDLEAYLNQGYADGVLNFDFKEIAKAFVNGELENAERSLEALNAKGSSSATYGNFLGSHDEDGFLYSIGKDNIGGLKNAITLQATAKGQPVIYYGEEIGLSGANNYPQYDNRYDMDWSLVNASNDILSHYQKVLNIRKNYSKIFAKGDRMQLAGSDQEGFIAFSRNYANETLLVAVNHGEAKEITLKVPFKVGSTVTDVYNMQTYTVNADGNVSVQLPEATAGGTVILTGQMPEIETPEMPPSSGGGSSDSPSGGQTPTAPGGGNTSSSGGHSGSASSENTKTEIPVLQLTDKMGYTQISQAQSVKVEKEPVSVTITLTPEEMAKIKDVRKIGAYYVDDTNNLIYVGGQFKQDTIYFTATQTGNYVLMLYEKSFTDLSEGHWAKEYIDVLIARHILKGKTETTFEGNAAVTRAECAAMLGRMLNLETKVPTNHFKDIAADSWYASYVSALQDLDLMTGYTDQTFKPNQNISREEMAVLLIRVYNYMMQTQQEGTSLLNCKDAEEVATWAAEYVSAAYQLDLISGTPNHEFLPKQTATRAEIAKMLVKLLESMNAI